MSSPEILPGHVKITDIKQEYLTSRKTVERRRDRARDHSDTQVYRMFKLRTKDGAVLTEPSVEQVNALTKEGRVPEWFVARSWLDKEFGKRSDEPDRQGVRHPVSPAGEGNAATLAALKQQYEARISDLKEQVTAAERREEKAMEYAERDKQRFAAATAQLTQVLALPGITEATRAQRAPVEASPVTASGGEPLPTSTMPDTTPGEAKKTKHGATFWTRIKNLL